MRFKQIKTFIFIDVFLYDYGPYNMPYFMASYAQFFEARDLLRLLHV